MNEQLAVKMYYYFVLSRKTSTEFDHVSVSY